jgi:hypothetical protein
VGLCNGLHERNEMRTAALTPSSEHTRGCAPLALPVWYCRSRIPTRIRHRDEVVNISYIHTTLGYGCSTYWFACRRSIEPLITISTISTSASNHLHAPTYPRQDRKDFDSRPVHPRSSRCRSEVSHHFILNKPSNPH